MRWEEKSFDEIGTIARGKSRHRPRNDESLYGGAYPFIQTGDIKAANLYIRDYSQTYNEKGLEQSKLWQPNTLCITIAANIADTTILGIEACFPDSVIGFIADDDKCDVRFVKYFFDIYQKHMQMVSRGATQDNLSLEKLMSFKVPCPPVSTQRKIASILATYDELIENNTKRIKLLEEAAQNIYKEWFVHFRFPGYEKTKFENGLPRGWSKEPLKEYIDYKEGPGLRNWQYRDEGIPFLNIRVLDKGDIDFDSIKYLSIDEVENKYKHFLLDEFDHVISTSGTLGKVVTIRKSHLPMCLNTSIIRMRQKNKHLGKWYIGRLIKSDLFLNEMKSFATGSAQLNFGPKHLEMMNVLVPDLGVAEMFENIVEPFELLICQLLDSNKVLKEARDVLLPRLMNGEIDVEATIHELEEA